MNTAARSSVALVVALTALGQVASADPPPNVVASDAFGNTAMGTDALGVLTFGVSNTASGSSALAANTTGLSNTATGNLALSSNTEGDENTATGSSALRFNVGGSRNTATGHYALISNVMGNDNTAVGYFALFSKTLGNENTAVGQGALGGNTTGFQNTATGNVALAVNSTGNNNTATGHGALRSNTTGSDNTAAGFAALFDNTTGSGSAAFGFLALSSNTTGTGNAAFGTQALLNTNTGGSNSAFGASALSSNTKGFRNVAVGNSTLLANTIGKSNTAVGWKAGERTTGNDNVLIAHRGVASESQTMRIGTKGTPGEVSSGVTRTFIAGVRGVTTGSAGAAVLVDVNGQLGTISSSLRFKQDVHDIPDLDDRLSKLRPVEFRYKQADAAGEHPVQYGLIAEEVAEVFPELVIPDENGQPETVAYHQLPALLLSELQKERVRARIQSGRIAELERQVQEIASLKQDLARMARILERLDPQR